MTRDDAERIAVDMFKRENERWVQNALALFGGITAVFVIQHELEFPKWLACLLAAGVGVLGIFVILSVRATTDAWRATIRIINRSPNVYFRPFDIFQKHVDHSRYGKDFAVTLFNVWGLYRWLKRRPSSLRGASEKCRRWRRKVVFSVTRLYLLADVIVVLLLLVGAAWWFTHDKHCKPKPTDYPSISRSLTWLPQNPSPFESEK